MNMQLRFLLLLASFCVFCVAGLLMAPGAAHAQTGRIAGTVVDSTSGTPLPGVNVVVAGTQTGSSTGGDGNFSISGLEPGAYDLQASFIGYETKVVEGVEVEADETTQVSIALAPSVVQLEGVVAIGYGVQRQGEVTGSVATIDIGESDIGLGASPQELLQGKIAGLTVIKNSGVPGGGLTVRIRGGTSLSASNDPLYVIDGVPVSNNSITPSGVGIGGSGQAARNPLNFLNPSDIESITVLKDAAAAAIYGARGANGVIIITTKSGRAGEVQINYNGSVSSSAPTRLLDVLSAGEYRSFIEQQVELQNIGWEDTDDDGEVDQITDADGNGVPDVIDALGTANTNWQEALTRRAVSQRHSLALSGGSEATQYRASLGYENQEGIVLSSGQQLVTARFSADHDAFEDRLNLGMNLTTAYIEDDYVPFNETGGFQSASFGNALKYNPTYPIRDDSGDFFEIGTSLKNPVALAQEVTDLATTTRTIGNVTAQYTFLDGLTGKVNLGLQRSQSNRDIYLPISSPAGQTTDGQAIQREAERLSKLIELTANYNRLLGAEHGVNAIVGYSWQDWINEGFGAETRNFITDATIYNNLAGGGTVLVPYSYKTQHRLISFFGRVNYDYAGRYLLSASLRRDGSSRFGANRKWGLFPAVSAAWRISAEPGLSLPEAITSLKLRVGYGETGNQDGIGDYLALQLLSANPAYTAYFNGSQGFPGVAPSQFANPDLQWESTATFNVGLDYGFLNGRLRGSLDYYRKTTDNLLLAVTVPQPAVVGFRIENIGAMRNTGFEFALEALPISRDELTVSLNANLATNNNEVVSLGGRDQIITGNVSGAGLSAVQSQIIRPGLPVGTFIGPIFTGVNEQGQQVFEDYEDTDGDGLGDELVGATTEPGPDDRRIIGNAQPDLTYGLTGAVTWQDWDMSVFFRGLYGRDLLNNTALEYTSKFLANTGKNFLAPAADTDIALDESSPVFSSRWVQDASFLRLQTVTLGYTFDGLLPVERTRVYVRGDNLFVLTPYDGYDPEVNTSFTGTGSTGIDYLNYPKPRTFTLGVNLSF